MADCGKKIFLNREGTEASHRFMEALDPSSLKLNDFSLEEWMKVAYRFARKMNYFSTVNDEEPAGDWRAFFIPDDELRDFWEQVEKGGKITPHLALFISFVKLLEYSQKRFNHLTKRHLDFYYRNILKLEKMPATPDQVHVLFELAKNAVEEKIDAGTGLDGGKDAAGKKRIYRTKDELVAGKMKVSYLKTVYHDLKNQKIKAANRASSYDGAGGDFPGGDKYWWPFGYYEKKEKNGSGESGYPELPDVRTGFAISSAVLRLPDGERNIHLSVKFSGTAPVITAADLTGNLEVYCTGEKGWTGPLTLASSITGKNGETIKTGVDPGSKNLNLVFQLPGNEKAIVNYNPDLHGEYYNTTNPVCRFLIKTGQAGGQKLFMQLRELEVSGMTVGVDVRGSRGLSLSNDTGGLNGEKPFLPFGPQPVKHFNFTIGSAALFEKDWKRIDVHIRWKNTPEKAPGSSRDAFCDHYFAYRTSHLYQASPSTFTSGMFRMEARDERMVRKRSRNNVAGPGKHNAAFPWDDTPENLIVRDNDYFTVQVAIHHKDEWVVTGSKQKLFIKEGKGYKTEFSIWNNGFKPKDSGPIRLSLNQSFLHELFPKIYSLAFSSGDKDALIPNEPYTPLAESIVLDYTAEASMDMGKTEKAYNEAGVRLFHEQPFGQSGEHPFLKEQYASPYGDGRKLFLVPELLPGGCLYMGLENALPGQTASLLVQLLEGSENPEASSLSGKQKITWSVLCHNEWQELEQGYLISDQTGNFLQSGLVQFSVPEQATDDNTLLPPGYIWIKVHHPGRFDAVCKVIGIYAQVAVAVFSDQGNDLSHLRNGLPAGEVSKMVTRASAIKRVSQPFSSFGGVPEESDTDYYRRISERLRHKNRAITLWDYEHLILQQFPEIHKVKCLNHTWSGTVNGQAVTRYLAPGNILIVVIPGTVNKNVFDILQPRVSQATLNKISRFVNGLNSLHVNARVINPRYEEVRVEAEVKFCKGRDTGYYRKILMEDITRFLSPWAYIATAPLKFGISLYRSDLVTFIEELVYVDYLKHLTLSKSGKEPADPVEPSGPEAILVSAGDHTIEVIEGNEKTGK